MASTAQDSTVPLRGVDLKIKDDDLEDGKAFNSIAGSFTGHVLSWCTYCMQLVIDPVVL